MVLRYRTCPPPRVPEASIRCTYVISTPSALRASLVWTRHAPPLFAPPQSAQPSGRVGFWNLVFAISWAYRLMNKSSNHRWMRNCNLHAHETEQEHQNTFAPPFFDICRITQSTGPQAQRFLGSASGSGCFGVMPVHLDHPSAQPTVQLLFGPFVCAFHPLSVSYDVHVQQPPCGNSRIFLPSIEAQSLSSPPIYL